MSKIFAIYPIDKKESTKFLNRINTYLKRNLNDDWHCFKIRFNDNAHTDCVNSAKNNTAKFILFMGHGRSDCLYGSCAKDSSELPNSDEVWKVEQYYKNEQFIDENNVNSFANKIFFSFSCNSNENKTKSIGRKAIENGVLSFIGFGDITTDYIEENGFPKKAIAVYKGLLTKIIKKSLYVSIVDNYTVDRLVDLMKILTDKEIQNLILSSKNRHKDVIIDRLYAFKSEIKILGNRYEYLL
jgi:hypothetical protein